MVDALTTARFFGNCLWAVMRASQRAEEMKRVHIEKFLQTRLEKRRARSLQAETTTEKH